MINYLGVVGGLDAPMRDEVRDWYDIFFENLGSGSSDVKFPSDACPGGDGPMRSLRDVEEQLRVRD